MRTQLRLKELIIHSILASGLIYVPSVLADKTGVGQETDYVEPNELTKDDYAVMSEYSTRYNTCLNEKTVAGLESHSDPRTIVDNAMKDCAFELETLSQKMTERNIMPAFRDGYIHRISNRAARNTLRTVMMGMAQTPVQAEENKQNDN